MGPYGPWAWALWMSPSRLRLSDALTGTPFLADREPDAMKWSTPGHMHGYMGQEVFDIRHSKLGKLFFWV